MGRAENICASAKRDIADMCQSSGDLNTLVATRLPNLQEGALAPMQVPPVPALTSAAAFSWEFAPSVQAAGRPAKFMRNECPGWHVLARLAVKLRIETWGSSCKHHQVLAGGATKPCALPGSARLCLYS